MKIPEKTFIPFCLLMLASCNVLRPGPATSPIIPETLAAVPSATCTDTPSLPPGIPSPEPMIVYYYFVDLAADVLPEGSVVIMPDAYILAPTPSDLALGPDTAANVGAALEAALQDGRNGWTSTDVEIVEVTFAEGHANVVLQGEYYGVGDVTLIAARMQLLMTVFANPSVQTAAVTLNGDTIANMGISSSLQAKPSDYVFTRAEVETFMDEHAYASP